MEVSADFTNQMETALKQKNQELEKQVFPRLRENFKIFHKSVQTIINILIKKSLIQEDPYKYEQKISEVVIPDSRPFPESEKQIQMSIRLSNYESQLEFLNQYYQFNIDFFDMKRIKTLASLVNYIKWDKAGAGSNDSVSTHFYELLGKIQGDSDAMSFKILTSSRQELINRSKQIMADLRELTVYNKEAYKQKIRKEILPALGMTDAQMAAQPDKVPQLIKKKFNERFPGEPLYGDLIQEVVKELTPQGEALRGAVLKQFQVKEAPKVKKQEKSYKPLVLDGLKLLGAGGSHLEQALGRLNGNITIIENRKKSFGEKLKDWLSSLASSKDKDGRIMEIEVFEEENSISKTIKLDYNSFREKTLRLAKLLQALSVESSQLFQKYSGMPEEEVYKYLCDRISDLQKTAAVLPSIEVYLRSEAPREQRSRLFVIEKEMEAIKECVQRANQKRFEYVTRVEEQEQLKRLGID